MPKAETLKIMNMMDFIRGQIGVRFPQEEEGYTAETEDTSEDTPASPESFESTAPETEDAQASPESPESATSESVEEQAESESGDVQTETDDSVTPTGEENTVQ